MSHSPPSYFYFPSIPSIQVSTSRYSSGTTAIIRGELRGLLSPKVNTLPLVRSIGRTMTQGKTYGPQITVKRISTRWERPRGSVGVSVFRDQLFFFAGLQESRATVVVSFASFSLYCFFHEDFLLVLYLSVYVHQNFFHSHRGRSSKPIFVQIAKQVVSLNPLELRLPSRAWKVKLVGEGADDAGGVFDDTITEMCQVGWREHRECLRAKEIEIKLPGMFYKIFSILLYAFCKLKKNK